MNERVENSIRFIGDWPWWAGCGAALLLGAAAWLLYRRDLAGISGTLRFILPALRATAVGMAVLMLSGPVIHHRKTVGQLSRLLLFVDSSRSMDLADPAMDPARKIRILEQLNLLRPEAVPSELATASESLSDARNLAEKARSSQDAETSDWNGLLTDFSSTAARVRDLLAASGRIAKERVDAFSKELVEPARELAGREMRQIDDRQKAAQDLAKFAGLADRWRAEVNEAFQGLLNEQPPESAVRAAFKKFDAMPRWQRLQSFLLEGGDSKLLGSLAETHEVQLLALKDGAVAKLWQPTARESALPETLPRPVGEVTNLSSALKTGGTAGGDGSIRSAMVILSDGQHNEGESPVEAAKVLAGSQVPVFTVGFGSQTRPRDLAILGVQSPEAVFLEDRVRGEITLNDDMPAGQSFAITVKDGERVLWEKTLVTDGKGLRKVAYDFPVKEMAAEKIKGQREGVQVSNVPLEVKVGLSALSGDGEAGNNETSLRVRAVTQKRRVLLVDGRPRWEARYLRNLFERDDQWETTSVIAGTRAGEAGLARGTAADQFPADVTLLAGYDLIILGEVPVKLFRPDELDALRDFVALRGGAIAFVDGPRGVLREYSGTVLGPLLPVEWKGAPVRERISRLTLPDRTQSLAPFALVPDAAQNLGIWQGLPPPRWMSGATPLPGAEVLVEAETPGERAAAVVFRPFGAGRVLYHAFDESWRWRYEVADQHHIKYWNQVANWIAELPFAVRDKFVSLDSGAITYRPGDSADLRVRLRDGQGRAVENAVVDAILSRDGKRVATIRLSPDENAGGLFRGRTAALEPGEYEVAVESPAISERDSLVRGEFKVAPRETGELSQLALNEDLLRQVASASGGQYLREEHIGRLRELLAPMSAGRIIETDTALSESYYWFIPLILLLTIEWILRKRAGLL